MSVSILLVYFQISLVVFSGALLAVGGSDGFTHLKTTAVYSHENNTWR